MRTVLVIFFSLILCNVSTGQKDWWKVDVWAVDFMLPNTWACDPFSSSSVCDCPGFICDNGEWDEKYVGMVVYPVDVDEKKLENRKHIWGGVFRKDGPLDIVTFNGIEYQRTEGSIEGLDENKAWQLVSIDKPKKKHKHLIIYFWCHPNIFDQNVPTFESILHTLERTKS